MKQQKAYKYRVYPTAQQVHILARTFGCCRYVYNWALRERTDAYYKRGERLYYEDTAQRLTALKKQEEHAWLNDVSSVPLQQSLRHLDRAFRNFFEGRAEYPSFKKKRNDQAATYTSNAFKWDGKALTLAKMDEPLEIVWSRPLPGGCKPSSVTMTKDEANRYFVSFLVDEPWSKSTSGIHPPNAVLIAAIFSIPFHLMCGPGLAQSVASTMIVTSMLPEMFLPQDLRSMPVERLSDLEG